MSSLSVGAVQRSLRLAVSRLSQMRDTRYREKIDEDLSTEPPTPQFFFFFRSQTPPISFLEDTRRPLSQEVSLSFFPNTVVVGTLF